MTDFDKIYDRRVWMQDKYGDCEKDVIPMWIADMDFAAPQPIIDAFKERLEFPIFGYDSVGKAAFPHIAQHYRNTYNTEVREEWFVSVPSVMPGVNVACLTAGGAIMFCEPMYSHIRKVASEVQLPSVVVKLKHENGYYSFDFDAMEKAITPDVKSFILCNPHNPVGRCYKREELMELLSFCKKHDLLLVADEIHCEFNLDGQHIPLFSLCEEAKVNTVTVSSAGKICNVPSVPLGFAIIPDDELRERYKKMVKGLFPLRPHSTFGGLVLTKAYDGSCAEWKNELREYLRANRDYMEERIAKIDGISVNHNESTYLAWIDCTELGLEDPQKFILEKARVFLNDGASFGDNNFVRLNYGCPRATLKEGLDRIEKAVNEYMASKQG